MALATGLGLLARGHFAEPDFVMLYLLAIVTAATRFGRGPALVASALSVLGYDFFFVTPHFTFAVADQRHLLTFITMFVVASSSAPSPRPPAPPRARRRPRSCAAPF